MPENTSIDRELQRSTQGLRIPKDSFVLEQRALKSTCLSYYVVLRLPLWGYTHLYPFHAISPRRDRPVYPTISRYPYYKSYPITRGSTTKNHSVVTFLGPRVFPIIVHPLNNHTNGDYYLVLEVITRVFPIIIIDSIY